MIYDPPMTQRLFGRRRGRRLRQSQQTLYEDALPRHRVTLETLQRVGPAELFNQPMDSVWLEVGFGGGEHLAETARRQPGIGFIGCEIYQNGIVSLLAELEEDRAGNVSIVTEDARRVLAVLPDASISRAFVLFPDPWPKTRHHKRRFIAPTTMAEIARVLVDGAELRLATDDPAYLRIMLSVACDHPSFEWAARRPVDWRARPEDWPATRYEAKAIAAERPPAFLRLIRRSRSSLTPSHQHLQSAA